MEVRIARSAHRHGISDARIREAYRNTVVTFERGGITMHLGHDADGIPLEIAIAVIGGGPVVVHAMRLRRRWLPRYRRFLS